MIRGGVVDPQPREIAERALFYEHHLHQDSRLENEIKAFGKVNEIRDDFGLRGRAEIFRGSGLEKYGKRSPFTTGNKLGASSVLHTNILLHYLPFVERKRPKIYSMFVITLRTTQIQIFSWNVMP